MKRQLVMAALLTLGFGSSSAQDRIALREVQSREAPLRAVMIPAPQNDQMPAGMNLTLFVAGPQEVSEKSLQAQEQYQLAVKECAVLRETIASECRIESMRVSGKSQQPGTSMQSGMAYRITLR